MATEFVTLREIRCGRCGTRYEVRLFRRIGHIDTSLEIDTTCPICPRDAVAVPFFTVPKA